MLKLRFLVFVLMICPFLSFSQSDFFKGYVVTLKGDTLIGEVAGKESGKTLQQVRFKENSTAPIQKFTTADCAAFGLYHRDTYERHTVLVSQGKVNLAELSTGIDTISKYETVFLQVLQNGVNLKLYAYTDNIKTRFYVKGKADDQPLELLFYSFYSPNGASQVVYNSKYQRQLLNLFREHNVEIEDYILERMSYDENDVLRMVSLINGYKKEKSKYKTYTLYVGAGLAHLSTKYVGEHLLVGDAVTSKTAIVPFISAGIDVYINPAYGRTFFRIEASFFSSKHVIEKKEKNFDSPASKHKFKQYVGDLSASLLRNFYSSDNYKVYLGLGLGVRYANTIDNVTTYNYNTTAYENAGPDFKKIGLQLPFSAGVMLFKRLDVSAIYTLPTTISENYVMYAIESNKFKFGVNYRF